MHVSSHQVSKKLKGLCFRRGRNDFADKFWFEADRDKRVQFFDQCRESDQIYFWEAVIRQEGNYLLQIHILVGYVVLFYEIFPAQQIFGNELEQAVYIIERQISFLRKGVYRRLYINAQVEDLHDQDKADEPR